MRFILPVFLIGVGIAIFLVFANPIYSDIGTLRTEVATYNEALNNSKALENERDKLTAKYNAIDTENLDRIKKLLPENVDNIRLILEIGKIGEPYGMVLKDVKYNATPNKDAAQTALASGIQAGAALAKDSNKDYGVWDLEFSTTGTYNNFLNFIRDLQSNLRIVDISSINFSSTANEGLSGASTSSSSDVYKYIFKIKTYWLKN